MATSLVCVVSASKLLGPVRRRLSRMESGRDGGWIEAPPGVDDSPEGIAALKRHVRDEVRSRRAGMSDRKRRAAAVALTERLISLVRDRGAESVSCYASLLGEPDTSAFLTWAHRTGVEVLLPISLPGSRLAWRRFDGEQMVPGRHGIPEPGGELVPVSAIASVDLMLVPACAVDLRGTRLGWGLGYFDRMLSAADRLPPVFAVVHDHEVLPALPREPHDVPVDGVVTPSAIRTFSR